MSRVENLYYNILINYDPVNFILGVCQGLIRLESNIPILKRASDWYASIVSFTVPLGGVPLFFAQPQPFPNTNPRNTIYGVGLSFDGTYYQDFIVLPILGQNQNYSSENVKPNSLLKPIFERRANAGDSSSYFAIYSYTYFLNLLNDTIANLTTGIAGYTGTPPTFTLASDGRIILTKDLNDGLDIFLNCNLQMFMNTFCFNYLADNQTNFTVPFGAVNKWSKIILTPYSKINNSSDGNYDPLTGVITQYSESPMLSPWASLRTILLVTADIDTSQEWLPSPGNQSTDNPNYQKVLAEFQAHYDDSNTGANMPRSTVQYTLSSAWRLIDLMSDAPLRNVSLQAFYTDEQNNQWAIILQPREQIRIRICFHLKETFNQ